MRALIAAFATCCLVLTAAGYANYRRRGLERHPQDVQLLQLEKTKGPFGRLMLSDSVTENALRDMAFSDEVYPLLTHGWMKLMGQFLMFQRVLERGPVKAMDLYLVPDALIIDIDSHEEGRIAHTYTDTLFTRAEEIRQLREAGYAEAGERFVLPELIYKSLQPGKRRLAERYAVWSAAPVPGESDVSPEAQQRISMRIRELASNPLTRQNSHALQRFSQACREHSIQCRIIMEPMPASIPRYDLSDLRRAAEGIEVVDINDVARFPDYAFRDGLHLKGPDGERYYQTLLAERGLVHFASRFPIGKLPAWGGEPMSFGTGKVAIPAYASGFHPAESWGRWTSGQHADVYVHLLPQTSAARRTLQIDVTALVKKGPLNVAVRAGEREICSQTFVKTDDYSLSCPLPNGVGNELALAIETSYVNSPQEWGEADTRALGIGLRAITLLVGP